MWQEWLDFPSSYCWTRTFCCSVCSYFVWLGLSSSLQCVEKNNFWIIAVVRIAIACKHQPEYQFEDSFSTIENKDNKETTSCSFCNERAVTDSPLFSFSSGDAINQLLEISTKKYLITKKNSYTDWRMVYEARKQLWMACSFSIDSLFILPCSFS